jgi:hypothetical protein
MGDVFEFLVDGTSGLAPGGVDGKAMIAGVCSRGEVGKAYLIGKRTDLGTLLGAGPLVDALRDVLATGGQEPVIVAVPVQGQPGGYIGKPLGINTAVAVDAAGIPSVNAFVTVMVTKRGEIGASRVTVTVNGTATQDIATATALALGDTGATLIFPPDAVLEVEEEWAVTIRAAIGPVTAVGGAGPLPSVSGTVLAGAEPVIRIVKSGGRNEGTYQLSVDGGDNYGRVRTIPYDGAVELPDYGVVVAFPDGAYSAGTIYTCNLLPPVPGITDVMTALESPLNLYDVEFVQIVGPTDSVDWAAMQARADELWNAHRPTYFKAAARLPYDNEDLHGYTAWLVGQRAGVAGRFVQVCCQFGEVSDADGTRKMRNWGGLQAGRVVSLPVMRATGRVKDGPVSQAALPYGWDAVQPVLEEAGYVTAKKYAGLKGVYWGDSRTLADDTSDYRYEEVLRVVFKGVRLARIAALRGMYDEAGDPLLPSDTAGLAYLKAQIENALGTMVAARPQELAAYDVTIPPGQDIVNNGVAVEITLIGIPIIRKITLYAGYKYAGSRFDPRLQ